MQIPQNIIPQKYPKLEVTFEEYWYTVMRNRKIPFPQECIQGRNEESYRDTLLKDL